MNKRAFTGSLVLISSILLTLPRCVSAASEQTWPFPGAVTLQIKIDEMTDRKICAVFTPMRGIQAAAYSSNSVALWVHEKSSVSREPAPMVRIESGTPFSLVLADKPRMIAVPSTRAAELIQALYTRKKIIVRWYDYPNRDQHNDTMVIGDFALAYDRAVKECGWAWLRASRVPLPKEPAIYRGDRGYVHATFAETWAVTHLPEYRSCEIRAGIVGTLFSSHDGGEDPVLELGRVRVFDSEGREKATFVHSGFSPGPMREILDAASKAGEYGIVESQNYGRWSLYGLREAVQFAEKTCAVSVAPARAQPPRLKATPWIKLTPGDPVDVWYQRVLENRVGANWIPPSTSQAGQSAVVVFSVGRDGQVLEPTLERSAGSEYDALVMRAVAAAQPLPPLPLGHAQDTLRVRVEFGFGQRQ